MVVESDLIFFRELLFNLGIASEDLGIVPPIQKTGARPRGGAIRVSRQFSGLRPGDILGCIDAAEFLLLFSQTLGLGVNKDF